MSDQKSLLEIIKVIPDYRNARGRIYTIESIRFCIICGFMCGCYNAVDISDYVDLNFDFFKELLGLKSVPSHDTLSLCLRKTDWCTLSSELGAWLDNNFPEIITGYKAGGDKLCHCKGFITIRQELSGGRQLYRKDISFFGSTVYCSCRWI